MLKNDIMISQGTVTTAYRWSWQVYELLT